LTTCLETQELAHCTLSLRPVGDKDFQVIACDVTVGQIIARRRSFGRVAWFWSLSGPHLPPTMKGAGSNAMTLDGAKAALKSSLDAWLHSTTGQRGDIPWSRL
jgi:hypothetical protein